MFWDQNTIRMKKFLFLLPVLALLSLFTPTARADDHRGRHHDRGRHHGYERNRNDGLDRYYRERRRGRGFDRREYYGRRRYYRDGRYYYRGRDGYYPYGYRRRGGTVIDINL